MASGRAGAVGLFLQAIGARPRWSSPGRRNARPPRWGGPWEGAGRLGPGEETAGRPVPSARGAVAHDHAVPGLAVAPVRRETGRMDAARGGSDGVPHAHDEQGRSSGPWAEGDPHGGVVRGNGAAGARHGRRQRVPASGALRSAGDRDRRCPA